MKAKQNVLLIVLDGWGIAAASKGNAITRAKPAYYTSLWNEYPHAKLNASGKAVGLLDGVMGNSEVGHLHIGAGRLVKQDLVKIIDEIKTGHLYKNKTLQKAMRQDTLHLIGLLSDAGVHAHTKHLFGLIDMAKKMNVNIYVHAILDGRDMPPKSAGKLLKEVEKKLGKNGTIATIIGRFYAMDRDKRWPRTKKAYDALVLGKGHHAMNALAGLRAAYKRGETDEFVSPTIIENSRVQHSDGVIFFNFRADRARQLTHAFTDKQFTEFKRKRVKTTFVTLTDYESGTHVPCAFPRKPVKDTLGEIVARNGLRQFRLAETEKWAHVTYFFNGLSDRVFNNEERKLIPSPKVKTYDKTPKMSTEKITRELNKRIKQEKYAFILVNFASPDMVAHTGKLEATINAIKTVDACLRKIVPHALKHGYVPLITADHGNAERLRTDGKIVTAHTTNNVPFILVGQGNLRKTGALYNIAPTILELMGLRIPPLWKKSLLT